MTNRVEPLNLDLANDLEALRAQHVWYEEDQKYFIQVTKQWRAVTMIDTIKHYFPNARAITPVTDRTVDQITVCIGTIFDFIQYTPPKPKRKLSATYTIETAEEIATDFGMNNIARD